MVFHQRAASSNRALLAAKHEANMSLTPLYRMLFLAKETREAAEILRQKGWEFYHGAKWLKVANFPLKRMAQKFF